MSRQSPSQGITRSDHTVLSVPLPCSTRPPQPKSSSDATTSTSKEKAVFPTSNNPRYKRHGHTATRRDSMPPPLSRFPSGPNNISPYHQQYPGHGQHSTSHPPPMGGNPSYLNPNTQANPFSANNNLLGLGGGLNNAGGFGVGGDSGLASHAARMGFAHAGSLQQQQQQQPQAQRQQQQQQHAAQQHAQHSQHVQNAQQHAQGQQGHSLAELNTRAAPKSRIREVWKHNLQEEMANLRDLVDKYPYIAMVRRRSSVRCRRDGSS